MYGRIEHYVQSADLVDQAEEVLQVHVFEVDVDRLAWSIAELASPSWQRSGLAVEAICRRLHRGCGEFCGAGEDCAGLANSLEACVR